MATGTRDGGAPGGDLRRRRPVPRQTRRSPGLRWGAARPHPTSRALGPEGVAGRDQAV
ncbi:hypothetical protein [Lentzea xinjiangensis]|uniref:hypothetical protein n=1 Tax=Lentzea xinjiangensis TaxID=402600 RepID=UPI0015A685D3|nr:hypothetical protein [Lentzea xinjiangensis]